MLGVLASSARPIAEMRFLILSSILACAAAAPSGAITGPLSPLPTIQIPTIKTLPGAIPAIPISGINALPNAAISAIPGIKTLPNAAISAIPTIPIIKTLPIAAIPVAAPTISPGDLQAAAINAKVEVEDYLRAAADRNREIGEQALKGQADKIVEASNVVSEKNQESFWEVEDKKWQALTALQTAQAKIEGLVASNAGLVANNAGLLGQAVLGPAGALVYGAVPVKSEKQEEKAEELKTANAESVKEDSVQVESAEAQVVPKTPAAVAENEQKLASEAEAVAPLVANLGIPIYAPIAGVPVNLNEVGWQAALIQPGVKILTPGLPVAQDALVASVAGKSSW